MKNLDSSTKINSSLLIDELMDSGATYCSITLLDTNGNSYFSKSSSAETMINNVTREINLKGFVGIIQLNL